MNKACFKCVNKWPMLYSGFAVAFCDKESTKYRRTTEHLYVSERTGHPQPVGSVYKLMTKTYIHCMSIVIPNRCHVFKKSSLHKFKLTLNSLSQPKEHNMWLWDTVSSDCHISMCGQKCLSVSGLRVFLFGLFILPVWCHSTTLCVLSRQSDKILLC